MAGFAKRTRQLAATLLAGEPAARQASEAASRKGGC